MEIFQNLKNLKIKIKDMYDRNTRLLGQSLIIIKNS